MNRIAETGLEVQPSTMPETAHQPYGDKYFLKAEGPKHPVSRHLNQSDRTQANRQGMSRASLMLAVITVLCVAIALGAGLGTGLAARRKSSCER